jgi:hypothetical protein
MLTPSNGIWSTPLTRFGSGSPTLSRIVGAMSTRWWNCRRRPPCSMRAGQEIATAVLHPPPEVTILP